MKQRIALTILTVLLLCSLAPLSYPTASIPDDVEEGTSGIERIVLTPDPDRIGSASPSASWDGSEQIRETIADTHLGVFTVDGLQSDIEIPEVLTTIRTDIALVLIDGEVLSLIHI